MVSPVPRSLPRLVVTPGIPVMQVMHVVLVMVLITVVAGPAAGSSEPLRPLPDRGAVPPMASSMAPSVAKQAGLEADLLAVRAKRRDYERQIRLLRRSHFAARRVNERRREGLERVAEYTDAAAFRPLLEVLATDDSDVTLFVLDHIAGQGDAGQGALAWAAIHNDSEAVRAEALERLETPAPPPVLAVLDDALRSNNHAIASNAAMVAGTIRALEAIPLLMFAQATRDARPSDVGDLAWIAIETQQAFVANLVPVVGDNSGAFQPVVGVVSEGIVLRVHDAVVIVYRTVIHHVLVTMTSADWGSSTADLGYDMNAWWNWYNSEYVPHKNEQRRIAELATPPAGVTPPETP